MSKATRNTPLAERSGLTVIRLVHGSLFAAGVLAVVHQGFQHRDVQRVTFADTGMTATVASRVLENPHPPTLAPIASIEVDSGAPTGTVEQAQKVEKSLNRVAALPPVFALPFPETKPDGELSAEMQRVRDWVASRYRVSDVILEPVLAQAEDSANAVGLDPLLIVAVMAIESGFNPFAESRHGAQGLMQVIPRYHKDKIGQDAHEDALFDPILNVRVGTQVLAEGLRRFGTMQGALQYYAGALKDPNAGYTKKVLALKQRIRSAARQGDA